MASADNSWFDSLTWSPALAVETFRRGEANRRLPPPTAGVYVFSLFDSNISVDKKLGVIYVGESSNLQRRIKTYMVDPAKLSVLGRTGQLNSSLDHAGKVGLLTQIQQRSRGTAPSGVFLRWTLTADKAAAVGLEAKLLNYFTPGLNTKGL